MSLSLRTRTLLALAVLLLVGLAVANTVSVLALRNFLVDRTDQQVNSLEPGLRQYADDRLDGHGGPGGPSPNGGGGFGSSSTTYLDSTLPAGGYMGVFRFDGSPVLQYTHTPAGQASFSPRLPKPLPQTGAEPGVVFAVDSTSAGGPQWRAHIWGLRPGGYLVLAQSLQSVDETLQQLAVIAASVSAAVLIGVIGLGWWIVRVGLRPLDRIAATADAIAAGDLSLRAPAIDPRTEVGRLASAFNSMLAEIENAFAEQRASEARLRRFIADASHELRTPLTSVRGYAELFRRGARARSADLAKTMSRIEQEADRMGLLVDDMLLLARLDQGRPLERLPVDLSDVVAEAVDAAQAVEPDRPLEMVTPGPTIVEGDRQRLRQVVDNLLANIRVHTPPAAAARVEVSVQEGMAALEVSDTGPGIPGGLLPHVFERFYRVDEGRSRDVGGSGLGLSIVSAIATAHGGRAEARSELGRGATFTIWLPLTRQAKAPPPRRPSAARPQVAIRRARR